MINLKLLKGKTCKTKFSFFTKRVLHTGDIIYILMILAGITKKKIKPMFSKTLGSVTLGLIKP